jgi:transposase
MSGFIRALASSLRRNPNPLAWHSLRLAEQDQSGETDSNGNISRRRNRLLRSYSFEAATVLLYRALVIVSFIERLRREEESIADAVHDGARHGCGCPS